MNNVKQSSDPAVDRCRHVTLSPELHEQLCDLFFKIAAQPVPILPGSESKEWREVSRNALRILKGAAGPNAYGKLKNQLEAAAGRADLLAARVRVLNRELDRVRKENARLRAEERLLRVVPDFILNPKGPLG